ncbi:MAG: DUF4838 domain-containing protein [Victivallales bacterium]|nr:DUF4838 domain-containing protein [Victivallales bacterium]
MKPFIAIALCCGMAFAQNVTISENGQSKHIIVIPDQPQTVLKTAAKELADHLKLVTGAQLPVVEASKRPADTPAFVIAPMDGKPDEIAIDFNGNDILLRGQMPRGPLYAVYTFLEDYVGIRWWTATESTIPHKPSLTVAAKPHHYAPSIISRETFYQPIFNSVHGARMKNNGHFAGVANEYGGHYTIIGWCHTFYQFLPPEKYFKDHPEWYSFRNGNRGYAGRQLCLTNDEMRREFTKVCLERIRKQPWAGIIDVSQNDWDGHCLCPACAAIEKEEGGFSGVLLRFVNAVAEDIEKEYPNFLVETLAYSYGRTPPKITKPRHNVIIRLCVGGVNHAQPLDTGSDNATFRDEIAAWSKIAPKLFIWNYLANFHSFILPFPNYRTFGTDIRFFVNHNAISIFEQGDAQCRVGDFNAARAWIIAHLLWNPNDDEAKLTKEFYNGYYGAAAPHLLAYQDFLCDTFIATGQKLHSSRDISSWLTPEALVKARAIYAKAEEAVKDDPILSRRVRRERLVLDHACLLYQVGETRRERYCGEKPKVNIADARKLVNEFVELTDEWKPSFISENNQFGGYAHRMRADMFPEYGEIPEICKNLPASRWDCLDIDQFRIYEINHRAFLDKDSGAEKGLVAWMRGNYPDWLVQCDLHEGYDITKKWKARLRVRIEAKAKDGVGLNFGVYDQQDKKGLYSKKIAISEFDGNNYTVIETPYFNLGHKMYLWFSPPDRPLDEVEKVFIDRVILLREE